MKVSPRRDWGMLFALFLVLTVVAVTLGGVAIWTLYSAGLEHEKKSLAAVVKIEVDRIEAAIRSEQTPIDDLKLIPPLGESGELFVFRQDVEGPEVIRHWANHVTSLSSADREAIVNSDMFRLALSGQSGIHEGRDFRGNEVVAAYAPVAGLGMGVVGKIDISEFRAPFFTAAQGVAGVSIVLIALGTVVFLYLSDSILQRIRAGEARFRELFEHLNSGVAIYLYSDQDGKLTVKDLNRAAEQILNVDRSAVVGLSVAEAFPGLKAAGLTDVLYRVAKSGEVEQFPEWFYHDERGSGWRKSYVFRLPSGEVVSLFDDITKKRRTKKNCVKARRAGGAYSICNPSPRSSWIAKRRFAFWIGQRRRCSAIRTKNWSAFRSATRYLVAMLHKLTSSVPPVQLSMPRWKPSPCSGAGRNIIYCSFATYRRTVGRKATSASCSRPLSKAPPRS